MLNFVSISIQYHYVKGKVTAIPIHAWTCTYKLPEVEAHRISRQPAYEGGKFISSTHWPPLPSGDIPGTHFC